MTVAAVILPAGPEDALADAAGRSAARRIVETAWAGGATPIVVICRDEDGRLAAALAGSPAVLAEPVPGAGPAEQLLRGARLAGERVGETEAMLAWPGSMVWVDAETVTSLIEAYGAERGALLRPRYGDQPGWPVLLPLERLTAASARAVVVDVLGGREQTRLLDTGDPGTVLDSRTSIDALPEFEGPAEPVAGPPPDWGASAADAPDEGPLQGPALAPYGQAADEDR